MLTTLHRLSLMGLMFRSSVDLFDRVGRDPCYRAGITDWIDNLDLRPGARVMELGCGPGILSLDLARRGCRVVALDRSREMIARLQKSATSQRATIETRVGDACETGDASGAFDAVIGASLLNIVQNPDTLTAEALRLLAPGGQASFYFPHPAFNRKNVRSYVETKRLPPSSAAILLTWSGVARKLDAASAQALLSEAGARNIQFREHLGGMIGSITGLSAC